MNAHSSIDIDVLTIDLSEHDKRIREEAIEEFATALKELPMDDRELYKYAVRDEYSFDEYVDWIVEQLVTK